MTTLRKSVSLGNPGSPPVPGGTTLADLYAGRTTDNPPKYQLIYFLDSQTPWVRLAAEWQFIWGSVDGDKKFGANTKSDEPPPPPHPRTQAYQIPLQVSTPGTSQYMSLQNLDFNIFVAKLYGLKVVLYMLTAPLWVTETVQGASQSAYVFPPDSALIPVKRNARGGAVPPDGKEFRVYDHAWAHWLQFLMQRYHPSNKLSSDPHLKYRWVDFIEFVNEPNLQSFPNTQSSRVRSTALMMTTAQGLLARVNNSNPKGAGPLRILGPSTADTDDKGIRGYSRFTTALIDQLQQPLFFKEGSGKKRTYRFNPADPAHGWSHHNYNDVQQIGKAAGGLAASGASSSQITALAPGFYGKRTQRVRGLLYSGGTSTKRPPDNQNNASWWRGYKSQSSPAPGLWLTEGGCSLEKMPGFTGMDTLTPDGQTTHGQPENPNTDYTTNPPANPAVVQRQLQAFAIGGAVEALQHTPKGHGVEMFTNFLFYDEPWFHVGVNQKTGAPEAFQGVNLSGLCDQYEPPTYVPPNHTGPDQPDETAAQFERPAFQTWTSFKP